MEKLVTLKEALPAMVKVFCRRAKGAKDVSGYGMKNERCINHFIYFAALDFLIENDFHTQNEDFYTKMFDDIYQIVFKVLTVPNPMFIKDECEEQAEKCESNSSVPDYIRKLIVLGASLYILEHFHRINKDYYFECFLKWLRGTYGEDMCFGVLYDKLKNNLLPLKDKCRWCADEKKLSGRTDFEIKHEAWADEFFGVRENAYESFSENTHSVIEPTPKPTLLPSPPFKNENDAAVWKERLMEFYGEEIHTPLNTSKYNHILRCLVWFMEEWNEQGLINKSPDRDTIRFLIEKCGFKRDGVKEDRIAGKLGDLRKKTDELSKEKELVRKYMESIHENT